MVTIVTMSAMNYEPLVENCEANKTTQILDILRCGSGLNVLTLSGIERMPLAATMNPQNSISGCAKVHFLSLAKSFSARSFCKTLRCNRCMRWKTLCRPRVRSWSVESVRCVAEAKRHYAELETPELRLKSCLRCVFMAD